MAVVVVRAALVALALLSACAGRVSSRPTTSAQEALQGPQWCVLAVIADRNLVACTDSLDTCQVWRRQARERGRWVGVKSLSSCEPVTLEAVP